MRKILNCERCRFKARNYNIVCAIHPDDPTKDTCFDFEADPELEGKYFVDFLGLQHQGEAEQWEPEGVSFYNGELILQPRRLRTQEAQLELLDYHPIFTGVCPACNAEFERDYRALVHWDCPCG